MNVPKRKGPYWVTYANGKKGIAFWKALDKKSAPQWFAISDPENPTHPKIETLVRTEDIKEFRTPSKEELLKATTVEPSREEKIEKSRQDYRNKNYEAPAITPGRSEFLPNVGDALEVGHLNNAVAEKIWECPEGPLVTFSFDSRKNDAHGRESDEVSREFYTFHYSNVFVASKVRPTSLFRSSILSALTPLNTSLGSIADRCIFGRATTETQYQREYVWSDEDAQKFLDSVFNGKPLGLFVFLRQPFPLPEEVMDGKQRLTTFMRFVNNEISYQGYYWSQLSRLDRHRAGDRNVPLLEIDAHRYKQSDLFKIFLDLNVAGVPQTEAHLSKVEALYKLELEKEKNL